jgi:ABC-type phosphate transport system substrate-binding protein
MRTTMKPLLALRRSPGFARLGLVAAVIAAPLLACTALINHDADQCSTDGDCAQFGNHPVCQSGVCVSSGLGPVGCFLGDASTVDQFLNQCSTSQCLVSDPCALNGICDDDAQAPIVAPDAAAASTTTTSDAAPPPFCSQVAANVVFTAGSTALQPFLAVVATLPPIGTTSYTIVYANTGSCTGVASQLDTNPAKHLVSGAAVYFDTSGTSHPCLLDPGGSAIDVGISDVFASSCSEPEPIAGGAVAEYRGPIQAMTMVVPQASSQNTITAAQAHLVFGTGGGGVPEPDASTFPWTDPTLYFVRNSGSGTQQMLSRAFNVPATQWWGVDRGGSGAVATGLQAVDPAKADQAIGILSTDVVDPLRGKLKYLAFQESGQSCGYYPDSSSATKDKLSIRDGHYPVWGPVHMFTQVTASLPNAAAQSIVARFGQTALDQTLLNKIIDVGLVPQCAMTVARDSELGPIHEQAPDFECGCYMDSRVIGATAPGCVSCNSGADCSGVPGKPQCNYGYCEASQVSATTPTFP